MRRYTVYLGNGEVIECYRNVWDWLWFDNPLTSDFVRFRLDNGDTMKVSKHFTIRVVELKNKQVKSK